MSSEHLERIFTIFQRLHTNEKYEGTGIGLAIAQKIVHQHSGQIWAESELEKGSEFIFSIPFDNRKVTISSVTSGNEHTKSLNKSLILIAEDDEINYFYLNTLLKQETEAKIIHARNGKEAIDLFKANPDINLIFMDMKMPEIDGFEATRQIKLLNNNVNIIAITAYAMSGDEERIIATGCDGYLSKPISKKSLLEKIGECVKI